MFPEEIYRHPVWCLYDDMSGNTNLIYPWRKDGEVPCPRCGIPLQFVNYKAQCCGHTFTTGWGQVKQSEPFGHHNRTSGRGWSSVRPAPMPLPDAEPEE